MIMHDEGRPAKGGLGSLGSHSLNPQQLCYRHPETKCDIFFRELYLMAEERVPTGRVSQMEHYYCLYMGLMANQLPHGTSFLLSCRSIPKGTVATCCFTDMTAYIKEPYLVRRNSLNLWTHSSRDPHAL
jgi:hypothetical protein